MQASLTQDRSAGLNSPPTQGGDAGLGLAWGAFCGVVIGVGVSLSMGLFYSGEGLLVLPVVFVSMLLGSLFGHMLASLLADDVTMAARAVDSGSSYVTTVRLDQVIDLSDYRRLKIDSAKKDMYNHNDRLLAALGNPGLAQAVGLPDVQLFERMAETVHVH